MCSSVDWNWNWHNFRRQLLLLLTHFLSWRQLFKTCGLVFVAEIKKLLEFYEKIIHFWKHGSRITYYISFMYLNNYESSMLSCLRCITEHKFWWPQDGLNCEVLQLKSSCRHQSFCCIPNIVSVRVVATSLL